MGRENFFGPVPVDAHVVVAAVVANSNPVETEKIQELTITGAGAVATKETVVCTLGATYTPSPGDEAMLAIGSTNYGEMYAAAVQDKWTNTVGGSPAGGNVAILAVAGGVGSPYSYTVDGAKQAKYDATLGGTAGAGDVYSTTLVGASAGLYQYNWLPTDTPTSIAAGIKDALNLGSYDEYKMVFGAAGGVGENYSLVLGANTYHYITVGADSGATIVTGLIAAVAGADAGYAVSGFSVNMKLQAKSRGAGLGVSCTSTGAGSITTTRPVTGIAGQATWTATSGVGTVELLHAAGVTTDTASGAVVHTGTGTGTYPLTLTTAGKDLDSPTVIAAAVAAAAAANGIYTPTNVFGVVHMDQITPGVGVAVTSSITGAGSFATSHTQVGAAATSRANMVTAIAALAAGDADYDVTTNGTTTVTATAKVAGTVAAQCHGRSVSSSWAPNVGGSTFTANRTVLGQAPTEVKVGDGNGNSWAHTFTVGQTNTQLAAAMQALINASHGYVATLPGATNVVSATRTDYGDFAFVDQTTQNAGSTVVTPVTTQALITPLPATAGADMSYSKAGVGWLTARCAAGTSFDVKLWGYDESLADWVQDLVFGSVTVAAGSTVNLPFTAMGLRQFVEVLNFVGPATADVWVHTKG